jgi:tRNA G46 methylase TrmB
LHVATDVPDTAESIRALLAEEPGLRIVHALEQTGPPADDEFLTNFERKGRSRGGTIWRAEYERQ